MPRTIPGERRRFCSCDCGRRVKSATAEYLPGHAAKHRKRMQDFRLDSDLMFHGWTDWAPGKKSPGRRFGVEVEFFGMGMRDAAEVVRLAGMRSHAETEYGHTNTPGNTWTVKYDGSVSGSGLELVSPPMLPTEETFARIENVLDALKRNGAGVDTSCGLHVHHSTAGLGVAGVRSIMRFYMQAQEPISYLMDRSRRENTYCRPVTYRTIQLVDQYLRREADHTLSGMRYAMGGFDRYHTLNLNALNCHGTLEFREHHGTLDPRDVREWVTLTGRIMDVPKIARERKEKISDLLFDSSPYGLTAFLGLPAASQEYWERRYARIIEGWSLPSPDDDEGGNRREEDGPYDDEEEVSIDFDAMAERYREQYNYPMGAGAGSPIGAVEELSDDSLPSTTATNGLRGIAHREREV